MILKAKRRRKNILRMHKQDTEREIQFSLPLSYEYTLGSLHTKENIEKEVGEGVFHV